MANRLCILISGNGSNLQACINAASSGVLPDTVVTLVISNRKDAFGLQRARDAGIETAYHNLVPYGKKFPDPEAKYGQQAREAYDADLVEIVRRAKPSMVVCAGWMHPCQREKIPILNLHPALPGAYNGANAIERAYDDFKRGTTNKTGIMIHYVILAVDMGTPITTQEIDIRPADSLEDLKARIHAAENALIVEGVKIAIRDQNTSGSST